MSRNSLKPFSNKKLPMEIFYSNDIDAGLVTLPAEESGHCVKVLRHKVGDAVSVIDGEGTLYRCVLTDADPRAAVARIEETLPSFGTHPYHLVMAVCPTKNSDRYEWFAEKATEMGVDEIVPVIGDHSERKAFKTERLSRIVLSAAKQSLKARLPIVREAVPVSEFIKNAGVSDAGDSGAAAPLKLICYCDSSLPREKRVSIRETLASLVSQRAPAADGATSVQEPEICILIGPEGDFSQEELDLAFSNGWQPVHLGDSRLRTETAALAAVAAVYFSII